MSIVLRKLDKHEVDVVHDWLRTMGMPVNRMPHRDYADGVLVAKLLKRIYPRIVDLHNYEPRFSTHLKTVNWETLNFKVFRRIGLPLTKEQIDSLAQAEIGAFERLMWAIMHHTVAQKPKQVKICSRKRPLQALQESDSNNSMNNNNNKAMQPSDIPCLSNLNSLTSFNSAHSTFNFRSSEKIGDNTSSRNVPYSVYERALTEVRHKVLTLEDLLKQRDNDIKVLLERVKVYETENREFRKVFSEIVKEKLSDIGQKPTHRVRFNL